MILQVSIKLWESYQVRLRELNTKWDSLQKWIWVNILTLIHAGLFRDLVYIELL